MESPIVFYPRFAFECASKIWRYWRGYRQAVAIAKRVMSDPNRMNYTDLAIKPVSDEELQTLDLFQETAGGSTEVAKKLAQDARHQAAHAAHAAA